MATENTDNSGNGQQTAQAADTGAQASSAQQQASQQNYGAPTGQQAYQQPPAGGPYGQQQAYQQPAGGSYYQTPPAQQPYQQPYVATKDHVAAGLLAIFLGGFGIHKFYLGYNTAGFIMLGVTILGSLISFGLAGAVIWVIALVEGIIYLTKSQSEFDRIYVYNQKEWF